MILHVARNHGYSKVMTGDSCTRLAIKLMTSLALGRGAFLAWDTVRLQAAQGPPRRRGELGTPQRAVTAEYSEEHYPPHRPQGFSDERHGDVVVVRPMREHTLKEVAFYNRLFAVPSVCTPALDTKVGSVHAPCHSGARVGHPCTPRVGFVGAGRGAEWALSGCLIEQWGRSRSGAPGLLHSRLSGLML